jgi:hypothetical protein
MTISNHFTDRKILLAVIALQAVLFYSFYTREVAWYPPLNFDQASYLMETYRPHARFWSSLEVFL